MELLKLEERPAEFQWKDIVILYRKNVTVGDRYAVDTSGAVLAGNKVQFQPWEFYKTMVRVFVVGWRGVTEGEKDVPYSFDALMTRLPAGDEDLIMNLGLKIAQDNGFVTKPNGSAPNADLKNV